VDFPGFRGRGKGFETSILMEPVLKEAKDEELCTFTMCKHRSSSCGWNRSWLRYFTACKDFKNIFS
jgi:hypothetical protein